MRQLCDGGHAFPLVPHIVLWRNVKKKKIKGVPEVFGKLRGGGNKGTGFEIRVSGAAALAAGGSGQTVPLQGSAEDEDSSSHPTAA